MGDYADRNMTARELAREGQLRVARALDALEAKVRQEAEYSRNPFYVLPRCVEEEVAAEMAGATREEINEAYRLGFEVPNGG